MRGSETMNKYDKGYISLYRKFKNWRYYTNDNIKSVFIHCLLSACWEDTVIGEYNGKPIKPIVLKRGSFITSRKKLCAELGKTDKQIRYALEKLSRANDRANDRAKEITVNGANQYTIISVDNFEDFSFLKHCLYSNSNSINPNVGTRVVATVGMGVFKFGEGFFEFFEDIGDCVVWCSVV